MIASVVGPSGLATLPIIPRKRTRKVVLTMRHMQVSELLARLESEALVNRDTRVCLPLHNEVIHSVIGDDEDTVTVTLHRKYGNGPDCGLRFVTLRKVTCPASAAMENYTLIAVWKVVNEDFLPIPRPAESRRYVQGV